MIFSDIEMVFEEKLFGKAPVLIALTLPTSFSAGIRNLGQSRFVHSQPFLLPQPETLSEYRGFERPREKRIGERRESQ